LSIDDKLIFNPQKYYISIKGPKNIAFIKFRSKKIRFIVMMPEERIKSLIKYYTVATLSQGVQDFYNGPCAAVDIPNLTHEEELSDILKSLVSYNRENSKVD
jgi:hypothetical protein